MLRNIWKPLGLTIILMVLMVLLPVGVMAAPVGKISHLEGEADVTTPDGKTALMKPADPVSVGDILRTKAKSKVEVTFLDGNTIFLAERSRLKISEYEHKEESKSYLELFRGKTRVVVNNLAKKSALELHTPTAVAGVRGTIWIGTYENGVSEFYFEQGEGYGYSKKRPDVVVTIKAGQTMTVTAPDQLPIVRPAPDYEINRLQMDTTASPDQQLQQETPPPALPGGEEPGPPPPPPPPVSSLSPPTTIFSGSVTPGGVLSGTVDMTIDSATGVGPVSLSGNLGAPLPLSGSWVISGPLELNTGSGNISGFLTASSGSWEGLMPSVYATSNELGYLTNIGLITGEFAPGSTALVGSGTIRKTKMEDYTGGVLPSFVKLLDNSQIFAPTLANEYPGGQQIFINTEDIRNTSLSGRDWGIWQTSPEGTYTFAPVSTEPVNASWTINHNFAGYSDTSYLVSTTTWDTAKNTFFGQSVLAIANWGDAKTAVGSGTIMGSFDPATSAWKAADSGAWIETGRFLSMAADPVGGVPTLQALNIPSFLVGKVTLIQVNPAIPVNNLTNITMNNVTFFAPSTGAAPSIWATDSITGDYSLLSAPQVGGPTVSLSSGAGGLNVYFGIKSWDATASIWGANLVGGGPLSGGSYTGNISLTGGATGQFGGGSLTGGTAAGTAIAYPPSTDTTPPVLSLIGAPANITNQSSAVFDVSSSETTSYSYSFDGSAYTPTTGTISLSGLSEGQHTLTVLGTDSAGNVSTTSYTWTIDTIAPVVALSTATPSLTNQPTAAFTVSSTSPDPATSYSYSTDGVNYASVAGNTINLAGLSEGSHTVYLKGTDAAGNVTTAPASFTWTTDYTAPIGTLTTTLPQKVTGSDTVNFLFTAADAHAKDRYYSVDGGSTWQLYDGNPLTFSEGKHQIALVQFKADDLAGNESTPVSEASYEWFIGKRQYVLRDALGGVAGGVMGDLTGAVLASSEGIRVISTLPEGSSTGAWLIDLGGNGTLSPGPVSLTAGGKGYGPYYPGDTVTINDITPSNGYWLSHITADATVDAISGTSNLTYLSSTTLGSGIGQVTGIHGGGLWQAQDLGFDTYTETSLAFGGALTGAFFYHDFNSGLISEMTLPASWAARRIYGRALRHLLRWVYTAIPITGLCGE